jgi:hypothetical protein
MFQTEPDGSSRARADAIAHSTCGRTCSTKRATSSSIRINAVKFSSASGEKAIRDGTPPLVWLLFRIEQAEAVVPAREHLRDLRIQSISTSSAAGCHL